MTLVVGLLAARAAAETAAPRYRSEPIGSARALADLAARLGPEGLALVLKVNRRDVRHVRIGEALVVPEALDDPLALAPLPREVASLAAVARLIAVSRGVQAFGAYEHGRLVRWGPTSTGKRETPTPAGLFHTNWKAREHVSTESEEWRLRWYFNFHNRRGVSFHEFDLPGHPASHACVRLAADDARWLYGWAAEWILSADGGTVLAQGTPVVVFGDYAYDRGPPWGGLVADPAAASVSPAELEAALAEHLPAIAARQREREALLAAPVVPGATP